MPTRFQQLRDSWQALYTDFQSSSRPNCCKQAITLKTPCAAVIHQLNEIEVGTNRERSKAKTQDKPSHQDHLEEPQNNTQTLQ